MTYSTRRLSRRRTQLKRIKSKKLKITLELRSTVELPDVVLKGAGFNLMRPIKTLALDEKKNNGFYFAYTQPV